MIYPDHEVAGVILIGGQSIRMGSPKALLPYKNMLLYQYSASKLKTICGEVYLSHNSANFRLESFAYPIIEDKYLNCGPISGIISSLEKLQKPIFIMPCDTPLISLKSLQTLFEKRNSNQICTVYYNEKNEFYEPLIGIWELTAIEVLNQALKKGRFSLQKILQDNIIDKNILQDSLPFKNVNRKEDYENL